MVLAPAPALASTLATIYPALLRRGGMAMTRGRWKVLHHCDDGTATSARPLAAVAAVTRPPHAHGCTHLLFTLPQPYLSSSGTLSRLLPHRYLSLDVLQATGSLITAAVDDQSGMS